MQKVRSQHHVQVGLVAGPGVFFWVFCFFKFFLVFLFYFIPIIPFHNHDDNKR